MSQKFSIYWYKTHPAVESAFLFHCRDRDLRYGAGIPKGAIVQGALGFAVAEQDVPGLTGSIVPNFHANRECEWKGHRLQCMAHLQAPIGASKRALRDFNNVVCDVTASPALNEARKFRVPVILHPSGLTLINLEISTFEMQGASSPRRAQLV